MAKSTWNAGVWEQGQDFVEWSRHSTEELAICAARRYARQQHCAAGGALSWCGGVQAPDGSVSWYDRDGAAAK